MKKPSAKAKKGTTDSTQADKFLEAVRDALDHLTDSAWLGEHSPLAAPYFIGDRLLSNATGGAHERGAALRTALEEAMRTLDNEQKELIRQRYYRKGDPLDKRLNKLSKSKSTYLRHLKPAVEIISRELNRLVIPPLRAERAQPEAMLGRAASLVQAMAVLQHKQTVALSGPGGIGKTTLGAAIAKQWGAPRAFWFTVRPGLNDRLNNFVFALAYFLRGLGAPNTWRQLAADKGKLELRPLLGLLRHDLQTLADAAPLICVDEVDLLRDGNAEQAQLIALLEALHGGVPLLVIGQQLLFEPHQHQLLKGLPLDEATQLLHRLSITHLDNAALQDLWQATRGNPSLIKLVGALLLMGDTLPTVLQELGQAPLVAVLLQRIWRRLDEREKLLLMRIAVFRGPAPLDAWPSEHAAIAQLAARQLLSVNQGEVSVISHAREFVLERIPADANAALHLDAAHTYELRGEYTAAAHHYVAGKQPAMAVWVWGTHRDQELERGQGATALAVFRQVAQSDLPQETDRRVLAVLRAELLQRAGEASESLDELNKLGGTYDDLNPLIQQLRGDAFETLDQLERALKEYRRGIDMLAQPPALQTIYLLCKVSFAHSRLRNLAEARQLATLAQCDVENFLGFIEEEDGHYDIARHHYESSLAHTKVISNNAEIQAKIFTNMGRLAWRRGDGRAAIPLLEQALQATKAFGRTWRMLGIQVDLSGAYIVAGQHEEARALAQDGLKLADALSIPYLSAGLSANAAEACYFLGRYDEAEQLALRSLRDEQPQHRPYALTVLGLVYGSQSAFEKSKNSLHTAVQAAQESEDKYAEACALRALVGVHRSVGDLDSAQSTCLRAEQLFTSLGLLTEAMSLHCADVNKH